MNLDQKNIIIFESKYQLERYKVSDPSFFEDLEVLTDLEILPYDNFSPDPSLLGKRIETLRSLIEDEVSLACTASSIIQPLFDKKYIFEKTFEISKNQQIDLKRLIKFLINSGYERADLVVKNGQYAVRGSVIDIFPSNSKLPIRIDLFDDEVISIKYFKNEDQITFKEIDSYKCIAAKGYELTNESINIFKKNWRNTFQSDGSVFDSILKGKNLEGLEHYLPLFFYERTFFKDYFKNYKLIYINEAKKYLSEYWDLINERYEDFKLDLDRPPLPPEILFNSLDEISSLSSENLILNIQKNKDEIDTKDDYSYERFSITENIAFEIDSKVVHLDHGIGIYRGLKKLNNTECLIIEFDQGDLIYLPVHSMNLLSAYIGMNEIKLDSIRKSKWNQKKQKTFEKAYDFAAELIESEAKRSNYKRSPLEINKEGFQKFIENFPYELTPDQLKCSHSLINDFNSPKMMDRLICGEVGFGKTEMALRASYISYMNGFQVCLMVPTTILAEQHYETFTKRFSGYDVDVVLLTRNLSTQEKKDVYLKILNQPNLIVIGTHALMNNKLDFNNVGLLIIDEEHKFGVKQKEKIKSLKAQIDVMYLSATPIPRTLNLALTDLKDFSIIASPPHGRKPVETIVSRESKSFIKEAIRRETLRGGQTFYVCNRIYKLEEEKYKLTQIFPEKNIDIVHGQMDPLKIKEILDNFKEGNIDVLVCTTIIESGIDIPNANTLIVKDADNFGLSQLHQLRGRVGRSPTQAYAYFFTNEFKDIKGKAKDRITALQSTDSFNAGLALAMRDLEIRGAGEILGEKQSGLVHDVGLNLFSEMIKKAKHLLKGMPEDKIIDTSINLNVPAYIENDYLPQAELRLEMYKRLAECKTLDELEILKDEIVDRFGPFSTTFQNLIELTKLKIISMPLMIKRIIGTNKRIECTFDSESPILADNKTNNVLVFNPQEDNSILFLQDTFSTIISNLKLDEAS